MNKSDAQKSILNEEEALERFGGEIELYEEILLMFVNEPQFSLNEVQEYIIKGRSTEAASCVHRLKGTAGTIGADKLYKVASDAESVLRGKTEGNIDALLVQVSKYYTEAENFIRMRMNKHS